MSERTKQVILKLKDVRLEKGLSYQAIVDKCEANGEYVSLTTVKRVFAHGSEDIGFRYDTTLRPIVRVVLGLDEESAPPPDRQVVSVDLQNEMYAENVALKAVVDLKNGIITDLKEAQAQREEEHSKKVEYLKGLVSRQEKVIRNNRIALAFLVTFLIIVVIIDIMFGNVGWFRY